MLFRWRLGVWLLMILVSPRLLQSRPQERNGNFTPADDVELKTIEDRYDRGDSVVFSPDGRYFSVVTQQGLIEKNAPEDTIWIFDSEKVHALLSHTAQEPPAPLALVRMATDKDGPIIQHVRWLDDSSGVAFLALETTKNYRFHQLLVADIKTGAVKAITPDNQDIEDFDVRRGNYLYTVMAPEVVDHEVSDDSVSPLAISNLRDLFFPLSRRLKPFSDSGLWALINGVRFQVRDPMTHEAIQGSSSLSLSEDARSAVVILKAASVPDIWKLYKGPPGERISRLSPLAYHLIDLRSGSTSLLVDAPSGEAQHYANTLGHRSLARWSANGHAILLSNTFLPLEGTSGTERMLRESRPCTAVVHMPSREITCILPVKDGSESERYTISDLRFQDDSTVVIDFDRSYFMRDGPPSAIFRQNNISGSWNIVPNAQDQLLAERDFNIVVRQDLDHPPVVMVENKTTKANRVVWNPNPQLKNIDIGRTEVIHWKDRSGFEWEGGLVKPPDYVQGCSYPLVIQTHGFSSSRFLSNGPYSTAFAARSLAAVGIIVLQMPWNPTSLISPNEGPSQLLGFESAIEKLTAEGLVDGQKVGVIGFSRSVYHVLEAVTKAKHLFAAASLTDGITFSYVESVLLTGADGNAQYVSEEEQIYGSRPFTEVGLKDRILNSPGFNMYKVQTPLLLLQPGRTAVLLGWEPYAALRSLNKPVDLIMLPSGTHVMTNPQQRLASEIINVDWFRFWLKGEEDSNPAKAAQYRRWRELRDLQSLNDLRSAPNKDLESSRKNRGAEAPRD